MNKYTFYEYDHNWIKVFEKEKKSLQNILGSKTIIEHIGSSAVPNL